jgi:PmbA protein
LRASNAEYQRKTGKMNSPVGRSSEDESSLQTIVQKLLDEAKRKGADQAEAAANHDIGLSVTARMGDVENLEYTNDRSVGVTVYVGSRKGSASTSDFSDKAIAEAVAKAVTFASHTAPDEHAGLADADRMATDIPDLSLAHEWNLQTNDAIDLAIECENAAREYDKRISNSDGATVSSNSGSCAYGNTHGFLSSFPRSSHSISCMVIGEVNGEMQRDYYYSTSRDPAQLESPTEIGEAAAKRTVNRLGARKMKTTQSPILFSAELARGFIGHAIGAISGGAQYRRSTFLLDASGEQIFPEFVQIEERPHIAGAIASAPYDSEGVATIDRNLIVDGVLQGYLLGSYSARRLGLESTGNAGGAHNLLLAGNAEDQQQLLSQMGSGLLVHELIGQGVNGVTGDYSRGAVGFWVENGEISYPVHEITIAGNLRDLYMRIAAIGNDQDLRGGIRCGSLLVENMAIAGT